MPLVRLDVDAGVATVTLDDPDRRNALTLAMVTELVAAVDAAEDDAAVGALVVTGAGSAFCAGADLSHLTGAATADGEAGLRAIYEGFLRVSRCALPTVAAVNGAAVGAGMNLALACDVRLAGTRARFDTRFLDLGLHPGGGHTWMLRRAVGDQVARAMVLFGETLDAAAAERVGLVLSCVDGSELATTAAAMAARAATAPRDLAVRTKATMAAMATVADHGDAVDAELVPQVWSLGQPWFGQRMAELQARIAARRAATGRDG